MRLLILGGTGLAGAAVTAEAATRGHQVRTFSRRAPRTDPVPAGQSFTGDVLTGHGFPAACAGVDAVIDCVNVEMLRGSAAARFFSAAIQSAVAASAQAGVATYVLLSIVGADRFPVGYYRAKHLQESLLLAGAGPTRLAPVIARTTQFHEFVAYSLTRGRLGPVTFVPAMTVQPVALRAVARHLVNLAEQPALRAPELAGPRVESLPDLVRRYRTARRLPERVVPVPLLGQAGRSNRAGVLLPHGGLTDGTSFADWLADAGSAADAGARP